MVFGYDMLASMSFADFKVALPAVPSGVLFSLQHHASEWNADAGTSGFKCSPSDAVN